MLSNRRVEFWVWYKGKHGGSLKEVAATEEEKERIKQRLEKRGLTVRIQKFYRVN